MAVLLLRRIVRSWYFSNMTFVLDDVRSQERSGNYYLLLSISHFDPERTSSSQIVLLPSGAHLVQLR
jgi:hypothetical protein